MKKWTLKMKTGYKLHCFVNYLWRKSPVDFKFLCKLNFYFAKWWIKGI
jgi:hypothetical protein